MGNGWKDGREMRPILNRVRSNGMRQTVSVGVKVNFPFTITQTDGNSILQWLDEVIFGKE